MKRLSLARAVTYGVVALLGAAALYFTPALPEHPAAEVLQQGAVTPIGAPRFFARYDTLGRGESLVRLFARGGVPDSEVTDAMQAVAGGVDPRRIPAGMPVTLTADSSGKPQEIVLQLAIDHLLRLKRDGNGWSGTDEKLPWTTDTVVVAGKIASSLYRAMHDAAGTLLPAEARRQLTWTVADIFEYRVDMSRDLQEGDAFRVMVERSRAPTGATKIGKVLAATFTLSGTDVAAIRYTSASVSGDYFDQNGKSLRAAFLRAPLEFRRISSTFGLRFHPILGTWKNHKGTDYAAAPGTPVRAIGDGVVTRAGWGGGYGNLLEIRHRNGYVTRYGHLRAFAKGIHVGSHVTIGYTVAYVGTTGLSTGPHLHFEVLVNGVQRDSRVALKSVGGDPIPQSERVAFAAVRDRLVASLQDASSGVVRLASR